MSRWRDDLMAEIKNGGKESPCPLCGLPRVQRSDYIRCCRCGINWGEGEPLDQDPRSFRQRRLIEEIERTTVRAKREEPSHARR